MVHIVEIRDIAKRGLVAASPVKYQAMISISRAPKTRKQQMLVSRDSNGR